MSTNYSFRLRARVPMSGLLAAALCAAPLLRAIDPEVDARLKALEARVETLQTENEQLRSRLSAASTSAAVTVRPAGAESALALGGMVQAQAEFGDKGDSRFGSAADRIFLRRARISASGRILGDFDFKVEGEFAGPLGGGAATAVLNDGYVNWSRFAWANVRVGQMKTPFGFEYLIAEPKTLTAERSLGTDRLAANRQIGVQVSGDVLDKRLSYAGGLFNGTGANVTANDNDNFLYVGRVSGIPWQGTLLGGKARWSVGADGFTSSDRGVTLAGDFGLTDKSFTGKRKGVGVDTQFSAGPIDLSAEYLSVQFDPANAVPAPRFTSDSWYVQAACFVVPQTLQGVVRYETFDPTDHTDGNETDTWTVGANWLLKGEDLKLQLDYLFTTPPASAPQQRKLILRSQLIF